MLIEEIEQAETKAEAIIAEAAKKASDRLQIASSRSYQHLVEEATAQASAIMKKAEGESKKEAKRIIDSTKPKFFIPAEAKNKIVSDLAFKAVREARRVV